MHEVAQVWRSPQAKTSEERHPPVRHKEELTQKSAPLSINITGIMQQEPNSVQLASNLTQKQLVSASKAVATLEELNTDAAKKVYRRRLASDELRLIKIHPGGGPSAIKCSTFSVQEGYLPDYEALSYVCKYT